MAELEKVQGLVEEYLSSRKWKKTEIDGELIYVKNSSYANITEFKPIKKDTTKKRVFLEDFFKNTGSYFIKHGYIPAHSINIKNPGEDTLFTSAGVQIFNFDNENLEGDLFVAQPVIRTQFFGSANTKEGSSTSFVNVCTEKVNARGEDFVKYLDLWLNYLSSAGLYVGDMSLDIKTKGFDWGKGPFNGLINTLRYKGLEIGDFGYLHEVPYKKGKTDICDMGFGLERLTWAINKTPSYYDVLWPGRTIWPLDKHQLDIIRTATLIAGSGIEPENNNQGYKLRKFLKEFQGFKEVESCQLVNDFFDYWNSFGNLQNDANQTFRIISEELNRNRNLTLLTSLKLPDDNLEISLDPNRFAKQLINRQRV